MFYQSCSGEGGISPSSFRLPKANDVRWQESSSLGFVSRNACGEHPSEKLSERGKAGMYPSSQKPTRENVSYAAGFYTPPFSSDPEGDSPQGKSRQRRIEEEDRDLPGFCLNGRVFRHRSHGSGPLGQCQSKAEVASENGH